MAKHRGKENWPPTVLPGESTQNGSPIERQPTPIGQREREKHTYAGPDRTRSSDQQHRHLGRVKVASGGFMDRACRGPAQISPRVVLCIATLGLRPKENRLDQHRGGVFRKRFSMIEVRARDRSLEVHSLGAVDHSDSVLLEELPPRRSCRLLGGKISRATAPYSKPILSWTSCSDTVTDSSETSRDSSLLQKFQSAGKILQVTAEQYPCG